MPVQAVNPYESPSRPGPVDDVSATQAQRTYFIPATVLGTSLLIGVLATRWHFIAMFSELQLELSTPTYLALHPGFLWFVALLILLTAVKEYILANRRAKYIVNIEVCLAAVSFGILYAIAVMLLPFITATITLS